jgi:glycosyltransferase involved in cell wall biosynthesis
VPACHFVAMIRLAYIVTHPIQYQDPLLRLLAGHKDLDLHVFFLSDFSLHSHYEAEFAQSFQWDVPLASGYSFEVVPRWLLGASRQLRKAWPVSGWKARLRLGKFDAVWVHGWGDMGLIQAIGAAIKLKIPVLLRGESTPDFLEAPRKMRRQLRDTFLRRLFRDVSAFLCIGSWNREFYQSFGIEEQRLFSVPYAVDNEWFQKQVALACPQREGLRRRLNLQPGRPIILFAAKFIEVKAPDDLLKAYLAAFSEVPQERRPYLLYVGDGPLREDLVTRAGSAAGQDVHFLGFRNQTEMPALYDLCDLFVLPSRFEPWGLVINEVMNAAKPVIVSDRVGAVRDLVISGKNGWIFAAGDVEDLTRCLREAVTDEDIKSRGRQSLARINEWGFKEDQQGVLSALYFAFRMNEVKYKI